MATNKNQYAVILAGGSGTRFWPMSRQKKPKQFLDISGEGPLFDLTIKRIKAKIPAKQIFIVANITYQRETEHLATALKIPEENLLFEPCMRNTAPAICLAASVIHRKNKEAQMAVFPSDHMILNQRKFLTVLNQAFNLASQNHLVTLGIIPTRPDTGYGYLKTEEVKIKNKKISRVSCFTEKPNKTKAKQFIAKKNYFWNSGMFIWKTQVILKEFKKLLPEVYFQLHGHRLSRAYINRIYPELPMVSVDKGILEKAQDVVAVEAQNIGWSDLGTWESVMDVLPKDKKGNHLRGEHIVLRSHNLMLSSQSRIVAAIGLQDMIIIDTPDALLVCRKDLSQHVKRIVQTLQKNKRSEI